MTDGSVWWRRGLLAVLLLAAAARGALILATPHFVLFGDPVDYQRWAGSLATGHGFPPTQIASAGTPSAFRPPAYPVALAGVYAVIGVHVTAGRLLGALLGVLGVGLLAFLGRAIWGPRVGLIAGTIAAVFPPLVALSGTLLSESLFVPLELAFALTLLQVRRSTGSLRWSIAAGVLCGLAVLTRAIAELWILVAFAVIVWPVTAPVRHRSRALAAIGLLVAFVTVLAPWTVRNFETFHAFVPSTTEAGYTLAGQYNSTVAAPGPLQSVWQIPLIIPDLAARLRPLYQRRGGVNETQLDSALRAISRHYISAHPGYVLTAAANDTLRLFNLGLGHALQTSIIDRELALPSALRTAYSLSGQILAAIAALGLILIALRRRLAPGWLWALPASIFLLTVPAVGNPLKRAPLDPFLILLASLAIDAVFSARRVRTSTRAQER